MIFSRNKLSLLSIFTLLLTTGLAIPQHPQSQQDNLDQVLRQTIEKRSQELLDQTLDQTSDQTGNPYSHVARELLLNYENEVSPATHEKSNDHSRTTGDDGRIELTLPKLSPFTKRAMALRILQKSENEKLTTPGNLLHPKTIRDLNLFFYDPSNPKFTILEHIKRTETILGETVLARMLVNPTIDTLELRRRQRIIYLLATHPKLFAALKEILRAFHEEEELLLSLWNPEDIIYGKNIRETFYKGDFNWESGYWNSSTKLELNARRDDFLMFATPIASYLIPDAILPLAMGYFKKNKPSKTGTYEKSNLERYLPLISLAMTVGMSAAWIRNALHNKKHIVAHLRRRFKSLVNYSHTLSKMADIITQTPDLELLLKEFSPVRNFLQSHNNEQRKFIEHLNTPAFSSGDYFTSRVGMVFDALPMFMRLKDTFGPSLETIGQLDAYLSLAELYREHSNTPVRYTFAKYKKQTDQIGQPYLSMQKFWHPMLSPHTAVPNNITLGENGQKDMLLTGPNAAGKSTVLKSIALTAILAQTIGIVPADSVTITPFHKILTHLNVVDDIEHGRSGFEEEAIQAQDLIEQATENPKKRSLIVFDEMYNSVSPDGGEVGAFSNAEYLSRLDNTMVTFATHFPKLKSIPRYTDGRFKNYKMVINFDNDGKIQNTYKLYEGASDQVVALDLLREEGIAPEMLEIAYKFLGRQPKQ